MRQWSFPYCFFAVPPILWAIGETLTLLATAALLVWAPGVRWRWARILLRTIAGLIGGYIVLILGYFIVALGFGVLLASSAPAPEYRQIPSPSGVRTATLTYSAGFLGRDFTSVEISNRGDRERFTAYEYAGPSDVNETTLTWRDDSHLEIGYYADPNRAQRCEAQVANVAVTCIPRQRIGGR
jgi:hypothetical protein